MDDKADPSLASVFNTTKQIEGFMQAVRKQINKTDARESFSLIQGIEQVIQLVNYQTNKERVRIAFRHNPDADIAYYGTPFKFQEIVVNLLLNAIESYEGLPRSDTRARTVEIDVKERGGTIILRVEDNGCGMTPEVRARLFEPFFTTKNASKGIGIGLATIRKIIEQDFSGTIAAESEHGRGTTFIVTFPKKHGEISGNDRPGTQAHPGQAVP